MYLWKTIPTNNSLNWQLSLLIGWNTEIQPNWVIGLWYIAEISVQSLPVILKTDNITVICTHSATFLCDFEIPTFYLPLLIKRQTTIWFWTVRKFCLKIKLLNWTINYMWNSINYYYLITAIVSIVWVSMPCHALESLQFRVASDIESLLQLFMI